MESGKRRVIRLGQRVEDLSAKLHETSWPTVAENERRRIASRRWLVEEVEVDVLYSRLKLRQVVELGLLLPPVET